MPEFELTRLLFLKSLAFIYFVAFMVAANQLRPLIGSNGLLPANIYLKYISFKDAPSLFHFYISDTFLSVVSWIGVVLAIIAMSSTFESSIVITPLLFALLWFLYLSIVNIGQLFYGFGWESILLETGFLAIFMGPSSIQTSFVLIFLIRWVLFRVMFGAGLIKLRGDACWKKLTCLDYHYETQPIPNPLSWYFHRLPSLFQKASVLYNHFVELIVPFGYFLPAPICYWAGIFTILFQLLLILSGNLSWLNYLTIVLALSCFDDAFYGYFFSFQQSYVAPIGPIYWTIIIVLTLFIAYLSIEPIKNLFLKHQKMNACYNPYHIVNTYGAFGSISKQRLEIVLEGCEELGSDWKEYEFKAKPGSLKKIPPIISPYHYRLDWQMWFAAMGDYRYNPWILTLIKKLLEGDPAILSLMGNNPFSEKPPRYIRAIHYKYSFTNWGDTDWWTRTCIGIYLPEIELSNFE